MHGSFESDKNLFFVGLPLFSVNLPEPADPAANDAPPPAKTFVSIPLSEFASKLEEDPGTYQTATAILCVEFS